MTLPNLKVNTSVPFPALVQGAGGIQVAKANGIWTVAPNFSELAQIAALPNPTAKQIWVFDPVTQQYNVMTLSALGASLFIDASASNVTIATGSQTFTVDPGKAWAAGQWVSVTSGANPANFMLGQVTSYVGSTLVLNVAQIGGSGSHSDWTLALAGPPGSTPVISGTSTTSLTIAIGVQNLVLPTGMAFAPGQFLTVVSTANAANAMEGTVTSYNVNTGALVVNVTGIEGSGTFASWAVSLAGLTPVFSGTSTTALTIGTGVQTLIVQPNMAFVPGQFVSVVSSVNASNFMLGTVTSYNSATGTLIINATGTGGAGTFASWSVNISGAQGVQGPQGNTGPVGPVPVISGTSNTSLAIGSGSQNLTVQSGMALAPGQFVTIVSSSIPTNYMGGTVTSYNSSTGALIVNVVQTGGSGTFASWNVSLSAAPGTGSLTATTFGNGLNGGTITTSGTVSVTEKVPGGRLTLIPGTLMTGSVSAPGATSINYSPANGEHVPISPDGSSSKIFQFTSGPTDNVGPALMLGSAWAPNTAFDVFAVLNGGTQPILCSVPWINATTPGVTLSNLPAGYPTNSIAMTGRINNTTTITVPAGQGTFLGSYYTNGNAGQVDWIPGTAASGGGAASLAVWNQYNEERITTSVIDNGGSYSYLPITIRQARASAGNQVKFMIGRQNKAVGAAYTAPVGTSGSTVPKTGVGFNSTTTFAFNPSMLDVAATGTAAINANSGFISAPSGINIISANEASDGVNSASFGISAGFFGQLMVDIWM